MTMVEAVAKAFDNSRCIPPDPEREGYHWIRRFSGAPAIPLLWNPMWWHNADRGWGRWCQPEREDQWEYLGRCPSPDELNGRVLVPIVPTEKMLDELARIGDGPMISGEECWGYMLAAAAASQ